MAKDKVVHLTLPATFPSTARTRAGVSVPAGGQGVFARVTEEQLKALEADPEIQIRDAKPEGREVQDFTAVGTDVDDAVIPAQPVTDRGMPLAPEGGRDYSDRKLKSKAAVNAQTGKEGKEAEKAAEEAADQTAEQLEEQRNQEQEEQRRTENAADPATPATPAEPAKPSQSASQQRRTSAQRNS